MGQGTHPVTGYPQCDFTGRGHRARKEVGLAISQYLKRNGGAGFSVGQGVMMV